MGKPIGGHKRIVLCARPERRVGDWQYTDARGRAGSIARQPPACGEFPLSAAEQCDAPVPRMHQGRANSAGRPAATCVKAWWFPVWPSPGPALTGPAPASWNPCVQRGARICGGLPAARHARGPAFRPWGVCLKRVQYPAMPQAPEQVWGSRFAAVDAGSGNDASHNSHPRHQVPTRE
ncbi:hypothetical protein BOMU111920_05500 [Bordetella muralis]